MNVRRLYHGGKAGLDVGDVLVPSPPHAEDGCPICVARRAGRTLTAAEYRPWVLSYPDSPARTQLLKLLADSPPDAPIDPPSKREAVYVTSHLGYALFYASRSGHGDLYRVEPLGELEPSPEDHFPTWTVTAARVIEVLRRRVVRTRKERRELDREWAKADRRAAATRVA